MVLKPEDENFKNKYKPPQNAAITINEAKAQKYMIGTLYILHSPFEGSGYTAIHAAPITMYQKI